MKQLDDGVDHTFVSAGGSEMICSSFLFLSSIPFDVYYVVDPALQNRYQSTMDTHNGVAHPSLGVDVRVTAEALG
jgi:hypothetical protein